MTRTCPSEDVLTDMLADRLPPERERDIEDHLIVCGRCRDRLDRLTGWDGLHEESSATREDTALPHQMVATVAARLARAVPTGRPRRRALPTVPGYELVAEIGSGGCGVVYRAVDRALARTAAVKVLHDRAGPEAHERFRREAAALALLKHPNIVQIYGFGDEAGQPFLALEYVSGGTLSRFTGGQPQEPAAAARFTEALARGVGAANQAGLVHRDLKPSNVLLDPRPGRSEPASLADFIPKVTDFGVVKALATDPGLTDTRDFLGTPSYMAPEQAGTGRPVDRRSDVYALGAILYELLTGRPPFRAATPIDTLVQVAFDDPVSPCQLQPRLPRDLETICLKCLEKSPARRYPTAEALADDLGRFAQGRPVWARPIGWPARMWRWCRRSPARAAVAALAASLLLMFAVAGPIIARREYSLRRQADDNEAAALVEKDRARQHFELASRALDETVGGLVGNARLRVYGIDDVRADTLRGAAPYLEEFANREEGSPDIQVRQARAMIQLATVNARHGSQALTDSNYLRGIALLERLTAAPNGGRFAVDLASAHLEYGRFLLGVGVVRSGRPATADAERELRMALRIADGMTADDKGTVCQRDQKAIILATLASALELTNSHPAERRDLLSRAFRIREQLVAEHPDRPDLRRYAAMTEFNLGLTLSHLGQKQEAAVNFAKALAEERRLTGTAATSFDGPRLLSDVEGTLGETLFDLGRRSEGLTHVREARRIAESAALLFPGEPDYLARALRWYDTFANMQETAKNCGAARDTRRSAVELALKVVAVAPAVEAHHDGLLAARLTFAEQCARAGRSEATTAFAAAEAVGLTLTGVPTDSGLASSRAECFRRLAVHEFDAGKADAALAWLDRAACLVDHDPHWGNGPFRRDVELLRAAALGRLGRAAEADAARARADRCRAESDDSRIDQGRIRRPRRPGALDREVTPKEISASAVLAISRTHTKAEDSDSAAVED
jgi:tetratricopeptide (TPR) repeat protein